MTELATRRLVELLEPWLPDGASAEKRLIAVERRNLALFGYGVKAFTLSPVARHRRDRRGVGSAHLSPRAGPAIPHAAGVERLDDLAELHDLLRSTSS